MSRSQIDTILRYGRSLINSDFFLTDRVWKKTAQDQIIAYLELCHGLFRTIIP